MTFEQRMAELGVDLSDLNVNVDRIQPLYEKYYELAESTADTKGLENDALLMITLLLNDIAERDEIINRMETRIVNLTGERDWLKSVLENHLFCETCVGGQGIEPCVNGHLCSTDNPNYRYSGVPEDWRPDDE